MDEKTIQKRLKKTIIFVAGIIIMLLMISGLLITFLKNTMTDAANTQMHYETVEYKNRLFKQIDADFQNLNTLSSFIESSHLTTAHALAPMLQKANTYNAFITMGYFEKNGTGAMAILDEAVRTGVDVSTLDEEVKKPGTGKEVCPNFSRARPYQRESSCTAYPFARVIQLSAPLLPATILIFLLIS